MQSAFDALTARFAHLMQSTLDWFMDSLTHSLEMIAEPLSANLWPCFSFYGESLLLQLDIICRKFGVVCVSREGSAVADVIRRSETLNKYAVRTRVVKL